MASYFNFYDVLSHPPKEFMGGKRFSNEKKKWIRQWRSGFLWWSGAIDREEDDMRIGDFGEVLDGELWQHNRRTSDRMPTSRTEAYRLQRHSWSESIAVTGHPSLRHVSRNAMERYVIKFCWKLKKSLGNTHKMLEEACENEHEEGVCEVVAKVLADDQKIQRVAVATELPECVEMEPDFLNNVITGDETWCFEYDPKTKRQSSEWHTPESPKPKNEQIKGYAGKAPETGPASEKGHRCYLGHDNAPSHTALRVREFQAKHNLAILPQPPYRPDMAPSVGLRGTRFGTIEAIQRVPTRALNEVPVEAFQDAYRARQSRWQTSICDLRLAMRLINRQTAELRAGRRDNSDTIYGTFNMEDYYMHPAHNQISRIEAQIQENRVQSRLARGSIMSLDWLRRRQYDAVARYPVEPQLRRQTLRRRRRHEGSGDAKRHHFWRMTTPLEVQAPSLAHQSGPQATPRPAPTPLRILTIPPAIEVPGLARVLPSTRRFDESGRMVHDPTPMMVTSGRLQTIQNYLTMRHNSQ
ncbi:hypothetical protein AAG570_011057 [Ranatra chinensis]|uniref:Transposase n=1 Tax=Ranatra chinensis TaxID=642074 RepID=A0ABD0YJR2_9HEMI